ncbi:MAG: SMC family ATPase [Pirellulales bacterium]
MRILSVTVKNFRMHDDLTVEFDRSRTLVAGPNESGKSTLVDAIERVLFYPHRSKKGLEDIKPKAGGGTPEVIIRFERDGRTYGLRKVFKHQQAVATLADEAGSTYGGEEAEARLRQLLGLGDAEPKNPLFGWSHLWARQGAAGTDPMKPESLGTASSDLGARLNSISGTGLTESKRDTATFGMIEKEYDDTFTTTGAARASSRLFGATAELTAARQAASQAAARLAELEEAADTVIREESVISSCRETLADAEKQLGTTQNTLTRIENYEKTLEGQRQDAEHAAKAYGALREADAAIIELTKVIETGSQALAPKNEEVKRLVGHEQRLQEAASLAATEIKQVLDSQQTYTATEDFLEAIGKAFDLKATRTELEKTQSEIDMLNETIAAIAQRLRKLPDVDKSVVDDLEDLERQLEVGRGKLEAIATRIEVLRAGDGLAIDGEPLAPGTERILTDAADLTVGEGTIIRITPGGGESLAEMRVVIANLESRLGSRLSALGLKDVAEVLQSLDKRLSEEASSARHEEKIANLGGDDVQSRLEKAKAEIEKFEAEIARKKPAGFEQPTDIAAVEAALEQLKKCRSEVAEAVRQAQSAFDKATQEAKQTREAREQLETALSDERKELQELQVQKAALERGYGTVRQEELEQLASKKRLTQEAVDETDRAIAALSPETARDDRERLERAVKLSNDQIIEAGNRKANAEGRLATGGTIDLHGTKAAADARYDVAVRRHTEIDRRAQAVRQLRELFDIRRQAVAETVAAPLREKVAEYLNSLFGVGSCVTVTKAGDTFEDLKVARPTVGGLHFEFEKLSGGTKEQVAAACRLAMAELLAGGEDGDESDARACLPMVFDDAFVNSDPERIRAVQRVLELGAKRGLQIIVLSCNPQEYGLFGAKRIDLPPVKHASATVPAASDSGASPAASGGTIPGETTA